MLINSPRVLAGFGGYLHHLTSFQFKIRKKDRFEKNYFTKRL